MPPPNGRSPKAAAALGAQRERQEVAYWRDEGWLSFRTGGHSATRGQVDAFDVADVIAMRQYGTDAPDDASEVLMIEVKTTAQGPFERFGPTEREALRLAAMIAGATPLLVWWPSRGTRREVPLSQWPLPKGLRAVS